MQLLKTIQETEFSGKVEEKVFKSIKDIEKHLSSEKSKILGSSQLNKQTHWSSCKISENYSRLKSIFYAITDFVNPNNVETLSVVQFLLEVLRISAAALGDQGLIYYTSLNTNI
jgi:hypothetical protein